MKKRKFMKKGEFGKKGVAKIIEVILLILIAIIAIFLIWWLIVGFFGEQEEISGLKTKMLVEEMHINDEGPLGTGENSIMLKVTKGPGKQVLIGTEVLHQRPPAVDVVSVVDLSGSMGHKVERGVTTTKLDKAIEANTVFVDSILKASVDCDIGDDEIKKTCCENKQNCINGIDCTDCGGTPTSKNKVGIVGYGTSGCFTDPIVGSVCLSLSNNLVSLNNLINSLSQVIIGSQATCICCGINKAIELLEYSSKTKVIVVMSDGEANTKCDTADVTDLNGDGKVDTIDYVIKAKDDAIEAATEAAKKGIIVYSVGFGPGVDETTLKAIAEKGGGTYSKADPSTISEVYAEIGKKIIQTFATENFAHLKIMLYDDAGNSCEKKIYETDSPTPENPGLPGPLETRDYTITFGEEGSDCPAMEKEDIKRIEIYPVLLTSTGTQVIGPALDIWEKSA